MRYRTLRIVISKGWSLLICSLSVVVLALASSCRSKKVNKTPEVVEEEEESTSQVVAQDYVNSRAGRSLSPILELPGDSKAVRDMIQESNALRETLSRSMNSVVYGPPEVMERRAAENAKMRHQIDSIDNEINKARKK